MRPDRLGARVLAALLLLSSCSRPSAPKPKAKSAVRESDLARIALAPEAEARLDLVAHLQTAARQVVPRTRTLSGEVTPLPGRAVMLTAPHAGTIAAPRPGAPLLAPGARVSANQALCALSPLLLPMEHIQWVSAYADATGQLAQASVQDEAAAAALHRTEGLFSEGSVGERVVEEARARRGTAAAALRAAQARRDGIGGSARATVGPAATILVAPHSGVLREVRVALGQQVAAGSPLFEVVADDPIWIRVPISVAEQEDLDPDGAAQVGGLRGTGATATPGAVAQPVRPAPPTANPLLSTIDLFYQLQNPKGALRPGQRVAVVVPLRGNAEALTVPKAAILHDIHGATWVYENVAPQVYERRRVQVAEVKGDLAILGDPAALAAGARVVTAGASELLGIELGVGK